jgi:hypothetical protein
MHRKAAPIMSMEQASERFDQLVHDEVFLLLDLSGLLELEQALWQQLLECGVPRADAPRISAQLIARALTRIGEEHVKLATETDDKLSAPTKQIVPLKS